MRKVEALLNEYGDSHQNKWNVIIHGIAVPSIYFSTIGLIWLIPRPELMEYFHFNWAHVAAIPVLYYYFKLSGPIGAAMTVFTTLSLLLIDTMVKHNINLLFFSIGLFVFMWVLQFIGHQVEGKRPSFFKDIQFLLVGPAWCWAKWLKRIKIAY
jgi:uncharacterized membrane protein YGL010W